MLSFQGVLYIMSALASIACTVLLLRGFARSSSKLLFWSGLCFIGLSINNVLLVLDLLVIVDTDLSVLRLGSSLAAVLVLLYAFIWEAE
jgi:hypothetical protein